MGITLTTPSFIINGTLRAERTQKGTCSIVWNFRGRDVLVQERTEAGPTRALYEFYRRMPRHVERAILRLEADAEATLVNERAQADECEGFEGAFVIESDPYVAA